MRLFTGGWVVAGPLLSKMKAPVLRVGLHRTYDLAFPRAPGEGNTNIGGGCSAFDAGCLPCLTKGSCHTRAGDVYFPLPPRNRPFTLRIPAGTFDMKRSHVQAV